jgi:hypothetical protein
VVANVSRSVAVDAVMETVKELKVAVKSDPVTAVALLNVPEPLEIVAVTVNPDAASETLGAEVKTLPLPTAAGWVTIEISGSLMPPPTSGVNAEVSDEYSPLPFAFAALILAL